jgi:hypothetical protein
MFGIRPWQIAVLIIVLMLGGLIGSVMWSTSRNNREK